MKMKTLAIALLLLSLASSAKGQGSPYNLLGFGEPLYTRLAHLEGVGGGGTALADGRMINDLNPAAWSWLTRARLETSFRFERVSSQLNDATAVGNDFRFSGLSFGSPIWNDFKASLALGFAPLTNASHEILDDDAVASRSYVSEGGVSLAYLGGSFMPARWLALGAKVDVLFGNVRHLSELSFEGTNSPAVSQFQRDYSVNGVRGSFGLLLHGDSLMSALDGVTLGVGLSTSSSLIVKRRTQSLTAINDTTVEDAGEGVYPGALMAGLSYTFGRRNRILADVITQDFSQAVLYSEDASTGDPSLQPLTRVSLGYERVANMSAEFGSEGGLSRWALRAGAFYASTPFAPEGTGGVNEVGGALGIGIPMSAESLLNLSLTAGLRSPVTTDGGPSDLFMRAGVSVGLAERWFVPTRRDD